MSNVPESVWVQWGASAAEIFTEDLRRNNVGQLIEAAFKNRALLAAGLLENMQVELLMPGEDGALSARTIRTSALTLMVSFWRACRCRCCIFCPALRGCFPSFIGLCVLVLHPGVFRSVPPDARAAPPGLRSPMICHPPMCCMGSFGTLRVMRAPLPRFGLPLARFRCVCRTDGVSVPGAGLRPTMH